MNEHKGFTLLELLITLGISSLMLGLALLNYQSWLAHNQLELTAHRLVRALQFARTKAIWHRQEITFCGSHDKLQCADTWQDSWIILNTSSAKVLRCYPALSPQQNLSWQAAGGGGSVQFGPMGTSLGRNGTFILRHHAKFSKIIWVIRVSSSGRIRLESSNVIEFKKSI